MEQQTQSVAPTAATAPPPVAPAADASTTQPATQAAVKSGDTQAYRNARRAERAGKPLEAVQAAAVTPEAATATEPQKVEPPRKARDEDYISRRILEGVDRGTQELRAEIDRMKQQLQTHQPAEATREQPKPYDGADPSDPKPTPDGFENFDEYLDKRDEWNERRIARKQAHAAHGARAAHDHQELTAAQQARVEKFITQLESAKAADAAFVDKLTPDVRALKPFAALTPGERSGPANVVAEQVYDSPIAPQVLLHFSTHPDALARLTAMPPEIQAMPQRVRAHHHIQWIVKEFGKLEASLSAPETTAEPAPTSTPSKTLTSAPPPAQTLGSRPAAAIDPKTAAVKSGNTTAYRQLRRQERAAAMGRR